MVDPVSDLLACPKIAAATSVTRFTAENQHPDSAVTSHNIWFHRPFACDQWLMLRQHNPLVAHGRSFGCGAIDTMGPAMTEC